MSGIKEMQKRRGRERVTELCSGPGKLAVAMGITGTDHRTPMAGRGRPAGVGLRIPKTGHAHEVAEDIRVGISKAVNRPWRFLALNHPHVSVPHGKVKVLK